MSIAEEKYRHEYKYLVSDLSLKMLEVRLKGVMKRDIHAGEDGRYLIRSIYFDDVYGSSFRENEDGMDVKEKFRIRTYNGDRSFISLELKRKEHSKTQKLMEVIDSDLYSVLVEDAPLKDINSMGNLSRKLYLQKKTRLMRPRILIQYEREPYICNEGNVRVTFDRYISASEHMERMFEKDAFCRPLLPEGIHLLEVKWDEFLPEHLRIALENRDLRSTSFSKYYISLAGGVN